MPGERHHRLCGHASASDARQDDSGPRLPGGDAGVVRAPSAIPERQAAFACPAQMGQDNLPGQRIEPGLWVRWSQVEAWERWADARDRVDLPHGGAERMYQGLARAGGTGKQQALWRGGVAR